MGKPRSSSTHVELERKFDVPEACVTPSFDGLAAIARVDRPPTQTLEAVYHDTADLALFRWGITLRRREGGHDEGWHMKLPVAGADGSSRDELSTTARPTGVWRVARWRSSAGRTAASAAYGGSTRIRL